MARRTADSSIVAGRLKTLRKEKGVKTQMELSEKTSIKLVSIKRYEAGSTVPDDKNLRILSEFYNVSPEWILGKTDFRTWLEEYDFNHKDQISAITKEISFLEYCDSIGCTTSHLGEYTEEFILLANSRIKETYDEILERMEKNDNQEC